MDMQIIGQLMAPPALTGIRKLLCIQPHPDDNEIGMGGIIAKLVAEGTQVDYLTVTDGSLGDLGLVTGNLADIRKQELKAAGSHLGVSNFNSLKEKDGSLRDVPGLAGKIAQVLRAGNYDAVACPDPWNSYEAHRDHVITGLAAAQAAINCNLLHYPEGTETLPIELKAVLFYFTQKPNTLVDISQYFARKMEAVALHRSQITPEMLELYTGYFAFRGMQMSGDQRIFEGVKALLPLHLHCIPEAAGI